MTEQCVEGEIEAPVEKVWELLRDFGDLRWGNIHGTQLEGEGVGAVRTFTATGGLVVRERLEGLDDQAHELRYSILDAPELPWTEYLAQMRLTDVDGRTHIEWHARFLPRNVEPEQAQGIVRAIFENGIRNLQRATGG